MSTIKSDQTWSLFCVSKHQNYKQVIIGYPLRVSLSYHDIHKYKKKENPENMTTFYIFDVLICDLLQI